jgi:NSS family neurotransmitter:Na+ symporter
MTKATNGASSRGGFGSRIGFILAAAGSAIGLGNIWRFPYTAGENGGGAFVAVYLAFVLAIGLPVLLCELSMGRASQRNPVGAFRALVPRGLWPAVGGLFVLTGFAILAFYSVVAGWTLGYIYLAASGQLSGLSADASGALFGDFVGRPGPVVGLTLAFLSLTVLVVRGGVSGGIERAAKVLMPLFLLILLVLTVRSVTLPGAGAGLEFLFEADFSKITWDVVVEALGQALFSLSLGMGAMITYGSYLGRRENLPSAAATVAVFDTAIALLAGLMIFPALFAAGLEPEAGPGLVFVVVPTLLDNLPAGSLFGVAFYSLLAIAALTSTISLLEVIVAYFVDERGMNRQVAVWLVGGACFVLAVPSALSQGAVDGLTTFLVGKSFLDVQDYVFGNLSLSLGALLICLFVGWVWGLPQMKEELERGGGRVPGGPALLFIVRYLCPVAVFIVLVSKLL